MCPEAKYMHLDYRSGRSFCLWGIRGKCLDCILSYPTCASGHMSVCNGSGGFLSDR